MRRAFLAVAASLIAIGGLSALPAGATAPGKNGDITFRRFIDGVGVLFTIHPDGTGERRVLTPPEGSTDDFPDFASDGSLIAFQRCADLCQVMVVRPDGSGLRRVGTDDDNSDVALSPDVRRVAFTRLSGRRERRGRPRDIYTARLSGGGLRRMTRAPKFTAADAQVQWSPDGRRLLFVRKYRREGQAGALRRSTPTAATCAASRRFEPAGRRLARLVARRQADPVPQPGAAGTS